jgi:hypothetical protein
MELAAVPTPSKIDVATMVAAIVGIVVMIPGVVAVGAAIAGLQALRGQLD